MRYFIKRPGPNRKTFALIGPDNKTISDDRIDRVNVLLAAGIAIDLLEARMREIRDGFKQLPGLGLEDTENLRAAKLFLKWEHSRKIRRAPEALENEVMRAMRCLGKLRLETAEKMALQRHIDNQFASTPTIQVKTVGTINRILRFLKRDIQLNPMEVIAEEAQYITLVEFLQKLSDIPEPERNVIASAFATGARLGECFAMTAKGEKAVSIRKQWRMTYKTNEVNQQAPLKNKKQGRVMPRDAYVIPELRGYVKQWLRETEEVKLELRKNRSRLWRLVNKTWGCSFHVLRHSYATHLAKNGLNKYYIAENLGISVDVVLLHYSSAILSSDQLDLYDKIYQKKD